MDSLSALFDLSTTDDAIWSERLASLRQQYTANLRPVFVNDLRFGGEKSEALLTSARSNPRDAFVDEWDRKVRHRALWEFAQCDPAYDPSAIDAVAELEAKQGIHIPPSVSEFATRMHAYELVNYWQPTNNDLIVPQDWRVQSGPPGWSVLRIINENQGCCFWYVAWKREAFHWDPPVFVGDWLDEELAELPAFFEQVQCTANHWSEFLLDYAMEGDQWYRKYPEYRMDTAKFDRNASGK